MDCVNIHFATAPSILCGGDFMEFEEYSSCGLCPRNCKADRASREKGFCGETSAARVGRAALHYWEEPCISGDRGSGTVFFSGCALKCCYCQNYALSRGEQGVSVSAQKLSEIFLNLEAQGAHNINLVTAEHFAPHVKAAVKTARAEGLCVPVILNGSGYVSVQTIEMLEDVIDIYLTDFKYMSSETAAEYSFAPDYPDVAKSALEKMVSLKPRLVFDEHGMLQSGVIVRHLCLPSHTDDSKQVIKYVYETYGKSTGLSIMSQYTPVGKCEKFPQLQKKLTQKEYDDVLDFCIDMGIEDAYIQEGEAASESFIPVFDYGSEF